jgi:hypothetical protein
VFDEAIFLTGVHVVYALSDFLPEELARQVHTTISLIICTSFFIFQLCLVEQELFGAISVREFIDQSWARKQKEIKAPNVLAYIENFNKVVTLAHYLHFLQFNLQLVEQLCATHNT